jgi:hypothetical protein
MFIWSYVLVFIAAFFNAIMDTLENEPAFNSSIFKDWNKRFWSKSISWQYAKKIINYRIDGWHLAKSAMIFCLIGAVIVFRSHHQLWVHFISMGIIWNITFESFYRLFKWK